VNITPRHRNSSKGTSKLIYHHPGITLFELMAVVVIIGVISSIGVISFNPLWQKFQLNQTISDIESKIHLLRLKAILENSTYQMKIDNGYLVYRKKSKNHWLDWQRYRLNEKADVSMSGDIFFYSKGFTSPKTITIRMQQLHKHLIININGRTRKEEII
jgi:prepilin-type N-terminal cleavage/methylation domain-containing protein